MSERASRMRAVLTAITGGALLLGAGAAVSAAADDTAVADRVVGEAGGECDGSIPDSKIGIQLWNFSSYVGFGSDPATQAKVEEVLSALGEMGYRNVEPFTFNGFTATEYKALLDENGLSARSRHGSTNEATGIPIWRTPRCSGRSSSDPAGRRRRGSAATRTPSPRPRP